VTDRPDNPPGQPDREQPNGNQVVIDCGTVQVLLAHLMKGAVYVGEGQRVQREQPLAAIGNSGDSPEPHLHLQATIGPPETGTPVPMLFNGEFLTTNTLFFVEMRVPTPASAR
jgi:murein DD-endopeptidase MepM/ murein hydrolase activator NlpD